MAWRDKKDEDSDSGDMWLSQNSEKAWQRSTSQPPSIVAPLAAQANFPGG